MNLLFDLDGTLTDSVLGITRCLQHALVSLGHSVPSPEQLKRFIGPPLQKTFSALLETDDPAVVDKAIRLYRSRYGTVGLFENAVYPDIPEGLAALEKDGHRLWVATSKPRPYAERILEHFNLLGCFEKVYGSGLDGGNTEKPDLIKALMVGERLAADGTWMIGDRSHDIVGARANGLKAIGVLWGYGSRNELIQAAPDHCVASMDELRAHLCR